jgi:hypothetical protein
MRPSMALSIYLYACSQRILGVAPSPLALDKTRQHTLMLAARDSNLGSAYPNDALIRCLTDIPLRLFSTEIGCDTLAPRSRQDTATHAARSQLKPRQQWQPRHTCPDYLCHTPP